MKDDSELRRVEAGFSPDGIYGSETTETVRAFQRSAPPLSPDGIVGQKTMRALDARFGRFNHCVGLHFRSIALTRVSFDRMLRSTQAVNAQYGIRIDMMNGESLGLRPGDQARLEQVDQRCRWVSSTGEFTSTPTLTERQLGRIRASTVCRTA